MMKTFKLIASILLFTSGMFYAQETIPASGGNAVGIGGKVSYSVGQLVYTQNSDVAGTILQGVQQPYEISVLTGIDNVNEINIYISAYPNPTQDNLTLKIENHEFSTLDFTLIDINGKVLENKKIEHGETLINMDKFKTASYFLKVSDNKEVVKIFKIIKK